MAEITEGKDCSSESVSLLQDDISCSLSGTRQISKSLGSIDVYGNVRLAGFNRLKMINILGSGDH